MAKSIVHYTFLFFLLTALSGVVMRLFPFLKDAFLPYDHILHAHSHLAMLGWQFISVFVLFVLIFKGQMKRSKEANAIGISLVVVSFLMFLAFLYQGYGVISIVLSTLHIFVEYWAAFFIFRQIKNSETRKAPSSLFIKGSLIALILSSIGPYSLGFISANGLKDYAIFDMAIYFYLHFQYNGWLTLALIGLILYLFYKKGIPVHTLQIKRGFWIYFLALFPSYLLSVLWVEELGTISYAVGALGGIGQWFGVLYILLAFKPSVSKWKHHFSNMIQLGLGITASLLLLKSTFELGLLSPGLAELVYQTRSVIIGYLHLTLLGFISIFILILFFIVNIIPNTKIAKIGSTIFLIGFVLNEIFLFLQSLLDWLNVGGLPFYLEGLLVASILLAISILFLWASITKTTLHKSN